MNTNKLKLESNIIHNVVDSEYEFNRFDKANLKSNISVLKLMINTKSYSKWEKSIRIIWEAILEKFPIENLNVFCFISSPNWKKDDRVTRYYGLKKSLSKEFKIEPLEFVIEKDIVSNNDVIFYGIVKLTDDNAKDIFDLLSDCENGILFTWGGTFDSCFYELVDELANLIAVKSKSLVCYLDVVKAINLILGKGSSVLYPYAWKETGSFHLDIFERGVAA
ncbi:MAG: hypothetical protein GY874_24095 [Desulfobacteraceae bacterium]|nr:hypothetical protein [Desulfobacteraceae bacterium]